MTDALGRKAAAHLDPSTASRTSVAPTEILLPKAASAAPVPRRPQPVCWDAGTNPREFSYTIEVLTNGLRRYPSRLCEPTDFRHDPCPMLDQRCV